MSSMHYSLNFRPKKFSEIVGSSINNKLLLSIAKNGGPSTILMSGSYGCGKTTSARLFARAVNCSNLSDDICGCCSSCKLPLESNPCYTEYDSSIVSHVESIRNLTDELTFVPNGKRRVVVFDEFHLLSKEAMSALLKVFEEAPENIYYILCTTNKEAIIPTIISRSIVLEFITKTKEEILDNLSKISLERGFSLSDKVANLIALRSKGHMRDAHKLLEKYLLIGEDDFLNLEESGYTYFAKYFGQVLWLVKNQKSPLEEIKKHKSLMIEMVDRLMRIPVSLLKDDYQRLFLDLARKTFNQDYVCEPIVSTLVERYDVKSIMSLYKMAFDDFIINSFESDIRFQTALLSIYQRLVLGI